jgi:hypothetical protein
MFETELLRWKTQALRDYVVPNLGDPITVFVFGIDRVQEMSKAVL